MISIGAVVRLIGVMVVSPDPCNESPVGASDISL